MPTSNGHDENPIGTLSTYGSYTAYYGQYAPQITQHHQLQSGAQTHTLTPQLTTSSLLTPELPGQEAKEDKDGNPTYDWMKIRRNPPKTTRKYWKISICHRSYVLCDRVDYN